MSVRNFWSSSFGSFRSVSFGRLSLLVVGIFLISSISISFATASFAASYPVTLNTPNPTRDGDFGFPVAINGNLAIVGACGETGNGVAGAGNVYIFNTTSWALMHRLTTPNPTVGGLFGYSVGISGKLVIVGARFENNEAGNAYIFNALSGTLLRTLKDPNSQAHGQFGYSVSISGNLAVVGAAQEEGYGRAYVFDAVTGSLIRTLSDPKLQSDEQFGTTVSLSGKLALVGTAANHAYLFNVKTGALIHRFSSPNSQYRGLFGTEVTLSGSYAIIGAIGENVSGQSFAGRTYIFNATTGVLLHTLVSPNSVKNGDFGEALSISGKILIVSAPDETAGGIIGAGSAYVFNLQTGELIRSLSSPNGQYAGFFGGSVALNGKFALIGTEETVKGYLEAGDAYVFKV